jgi:hypothetical protein
VDDPRVFSDADLLSNLDRLAREERGRMPFFLACLVEADRRKLPIDLGYGSRSTIASAA